MQRPTDSPVIATCPLQVHQPSGKWAEAAVVEPEGGRAPPGLPHCLQYKDGLQWVRFVSTGVLEGWLQPPGKKGAAAAAAGAPGSAIEVQPFVVLPDGARTKGRPRREVKEAMDAAVEAAELYQQQQRGGGGGGDSSDGDGGSPVKRRRLSAAGGSRAANGSAAAVADSQQPSQHSSAAADGVAGTQQGQPGEAGAPSAKAGGSAAAPSTGVKRRRPGGQQQPPPAAQDERQQQQQQQQQQQPEPAEQQAAAADEQAAVHEHADGAAQREPPAQAKQPPKPPAVTELGLGPAMLAPLATVPVGDEERERERAQRPSPASQPGSKQRPSGQQEQRPQQQREGGKEQGAAAARAAEPRRPQSGQQQQQQPRPSSRQQPDRLSQQQQQPQQQPERPPSQADDAEAAPQVAVPLAERPGDKACKAFEALLPGLTAIKDRIHEAAEAAILAGGCSVGACIGFDWVRWVVLRRGAEPGWRLPSCQACKAKLPSMQSKWAATQGVHPICGGRPAGSSACSACPAGSPPPPRRPPPRGINRSVCTQQAASTHLRSVGACPAA